MQDDLDVDQQAERRQTRKDQERADLEADTLDIIWLMSERPGRRIMYRLLAKTGVYTSSFTGDAETFFREGKRDVGLTYLAILNANCPDEFVLMLKEQRDDG